MKTTFFYVLFISISLNAFGTDKQAGFSMFGTGTGNGSLPVRGQIVATEMVGKSQPTGSGNPVVDMLSSSRRDLFVRSLPSLSEETSQPPCNPVVPQVQCSPGRRVLPEDQLEFMRSFSIKSYESAPRTVVRDCTCFNTQLSANKNADDFNREKEAERLRLNNLILKSMGKKFVNDFSVNLEDAGFFLTQTKNAFKDINAAPAIQCNNAEAFRTKAMGVCGQSKGAEFVNQRMNLFINSMDGNTVQFNDRLRTMSLQIQEAQVATDLAGEFSQDQLKARGLESTTSRTYMRNQYDNLRSGLAHGSEKAQFVDITLSAIIRNPAYAQQITEGLAAGKSPYELMFKIIKDNKNNRAFITSTGVSAVNFNKVFSSDSEIDKSLGFLVTVHPGMMVALKDKDVFEKVVASAKNRPEHSMLSVLENDPEIIDPYMQKSCERLIENFANAVCVPDENLLASVSPEEVNKLVQQSKAPSARPTGRTRQVELHDLLTCEASKQPASPAPQITGLADDNGIRRSDYYIGNAAVTGNGSGTAAGSGILLIAGAVSGSTNDQVRDQVNRYTEAGAKRSGPATVPGVLSQQAYAQAVVSGRAVESGPGMSKSEARRYLADSRKYEESRIAASQNTSSKSTQVAATTDGSEASPVVSNAQSQDAVTVPQTTQVPSYVANATSNAATSNYTANAREALRNYIADKSNPVEADKAVAGLNDASADELNRLRSENETLLQKTLDAETAKYEQMKKQLEELTNKAPTVARNIASVEDAQEDESQDSDSRETSSGRTPKMDFGSQTAINNASQVSAQGGGSGSGSSSSSGGAAKIGNASSVSNAASGTSKDVQVSTQGPVVAAQSGLTISAAGVRDAAIPAQEISQEVQKYIETANLNAAAIEEIKTKGIVFKYSVKENDKVVQKEVLVKYESLNLQARQAIDIRLARKNVSNQVSKLAVLKLLISSSARR